MKYWLVLGAIGLFLLAACTSSGVTEHATGDQAIPVQTSESSFVALSEREVQIDAQGTPYIVDPSEIRSGGPPPDGIPPIDDPVYVSVAEADEWVDDNELALAITYDGVTRAYPLQIMVWHEIVNDHFGDERVLITYCPLCGTGIAYKPVVNGEEVEFGTSGKLWQSNLVMYDRLTDSYWTQIDGVSIMGSQAGEQLEAVPIDTVVWGEWKEEHPGAAVLSQDTGHIRDYGRDPYGSYYEDSFLIFPVHEQDDRVHAKTVVYSFVLNGQAAAYRASDVREEGVIEDEVGGVGVRLVQESDGTVTVTRDDTGSVIAQERGFWFSWYAFHPDTLLYGVEPLNTT